MEYITKNGIRFTLKDTIFSIYNFISTNNEKTLICLADDILIDFTNDIYCGATNIPF